MAFRSISRVGLVSLGLAGLVAGAPTRQAGPLFVDAAAASTVPVTISPSGLPTPIPSLPVAPPALPAALPTPSLPVAMPSLPVVLPTPSIPVPSPTLPVVAGPTPSVPGATPAPTSPPLLGPVVAPSATPANASPAPDSTAGGQPLRAVAYHAGSSPAAGSGSGGGSGILIPEIRLPEGAVGAAVLVAIAVLPLLLGIALLMAGRLWGQALARRGAQLRLALAAELSLRPRELASMSMDGLLKLRDEVAFDELTGVLRRVAGIASLEREVARARRSHEPLSAAFVDLDGLKRVNDSRGHGAGDALIRGVAQLLVAGLRGQDLVFRYGGDEFVCAIPGLDAGRAGEKLRELRSKAIAQGMSFSFGVAELNAGDDLVSFLGRADELLYRERGRRKQEMLGVAVPLPMPRPGRARSTRRVREDI